MWTPGPAVADHRLADHRLLRPPSPLCPGADNRPGQSAGSGIGCPRVAFRGTRAVHGQVDTTVVRTVIERPWLQPDHETPLRWARRTPLAPKAPAAIGQLSRAFRLFASTSHLSGVAGLAPQPNPVVTRAAVPDALARPLPTQLPVGCHATGCGPVAARAVCASDGCLCVEPGCAPTYVRAAPSARLIVPRSARWWWRPRWCASRNDRSRRVVHRRCSCSAGVRLGPIMRPRGWTRVLMVAMTTMSTRNPRSPSRPTPERRSTTVTS